MRRRQFFSGMLAGISLLRSSGLVAETSTFTSDPFSLGIASGDMTHDSVVLWTRIAPEPLLPDGGVGPYAVPVRWEVATDPGMRHLVRRGELLAMPEFAHSVHVDLQGLQAGRDYWYRFQTGRYRTEIGHTKTLADGPDLTARFVTTSCQNYTHGYFLAYEHMVNDQPDFVIHLGDYIYDTSFGETFRRHDSEQPPKTLIDYRRRHALYKTDLHLQRAHAALPFYCVIDNHDAIEDNDPAKYEQRAAAYRAWYEHMPVRGFSLRKANVFDMHRLLRLGDLMQISLLDTRQFRDLREKCTENLEHALGFGNYRERCAALFHADRTLLGAEQEHWLYQSLKNNTSVWNVIASSGPVMPFRLDMGDEEYGYIGAWDAYPANRQRLASVLASAPVGQPIILSGDIHSFWAMDGSLISDAADRVPGIEFVCSSISANWPEPLATPVKDNLAYNPHVAFYNGDERGYLLHDVNASEWRTRFRAIGDAKTEGAEVRDLRTFRVTSDHPILQEVI